MRYSGSANFDFVIERYKDRKTGKLLDYSQATGEPYGTMIEPDDEKFEYQSIILQVEGVSFYQSGRCSGPPEDCYPDEGDTEIISAIGPDGKDWQDRLTDDETESLWMLIQDQATNDMEADYGDEE